MNDREVPNRQADSAGLLQRLQTQLDHFTPSEHAIARYILANHATLAYENAASLAGKVGVSGVTVGRFARAMGFRNFKALKNELMPRASDRSPWLSGGDLTRFVHAPEGDPQADGNFEREVAGLLEVYKLVGTPAWASAVDLLSHSRIVQIAGFQTERGIAMLLANHLQFMRDGVRLVDMTAGNYADVFACETGDMCLVIIDIRRYSRQSYLVAQRARDEGIPLIVLTDRFCDWALRLTPHVLAVPTQTGMFWSSPVALVCAVNLLVNSVIKAIGERVETRLERLTELHRWFTGYVGSPPRPARRSPRRDVGLG